MVRLSFISSYSSLTLSSFLLFFISSYFIFSSTGSNPHLERFVCGLLWSPDIRKCLLFTFLLCFTFNTHSSPSSLSSLQILTEGLVDTMFRSMLRESRMTGSSILVPQSNGTRQYYIMLYYII